MSIRCLIFISGMLLFSCGKDMDSQQMDTGVCVPVLISEDEFSVETVADALSATIDGSCLTLSVGVGGCDDLHGIDMITDGAVDESLPVQMTFILRDNDPQVCEAYFTIDREFDLSPLDAFIDEEEIWIRFEDSDTRILYTK